MSVPPPPLAVSAYRRAAFGQRMALAHQFAQALAGDMGINLRGRNVGVAKHLLHAAQTEVIHGAKEGREGL